MRDARPLTYVLVIPILAITVLSGSGAAQSAAKPTNDAPNPYNTVSDYFKLPAGRTWGSTSAVEIDKDGKSIWVAERCGANSCLDRATGKMSADPSVMKFDASGKLVTSFGGGMLIFPHGIYVDRDGNVWVTDGQDNAPQPARGTGPGTGGTAATTAGGTSAAGGAAGTGAAAPGTAAGQRGASQGSARMGPLPGSTIGHQVIKFSPEGKVLLTLGKAGGAAAPDYFYQPNDIVVGANGDIFVAEGHGGANDRILKFSKDGKLIKTIGKKGSGPGEFNQPHALGLDSRGRLIVGDRGNNRIQILDQEGKFISETAEFGRPSGLWVDKNDVLYVADSESGSVSPTRPEWRRGIRIGKLSDGKVTAFIPDPEARNAPEFRGTSAAEGVAVDADGNIYGAEVGPRALRKYTKK
jgi:sugar lactone lactonase YvrE